MLFSFQHRFNGLRSKVRVFCCHVFIYITLLSDEMPIAYPNRVFCTFVFTQKAHNVAKNVDFLPNLTLFSQKNQHMFE
jgi:hypothetical protein